jgi:amino acid adenylation domain-containing protein
MKGNSTTGTSRRGQCQVEIDAHTASSLQQISQNSDVGLFILFLSGVTLVLGRYAGIEDLAVSTLSPGEPFEPLILRSPITGTLTANEFLEQTRKVVIDAFNAASQDSQNVSAKAATQNKKDLRKASRTVCLYSKLHPAWDQAQKNELLIVLRNHDGRLDTYAEYDTALYDAHLVERFLKNIAYIAGRLPRLLNHPLRSIEIVCPDEKAQLLSFNQTATDYPSEKTVHKLLEEQVAVCPDKPAIAFRDTTITYQELNQRANSLAHIIRARGVKRGDRVALITEPDPAAIIAILAIAKAGGCYVPISPNYPDARKKLMLERVGASLIVTTSSAAKTVAQMGATLEVLLADDLNTAATDLENPANCNESDDPLFVPFTSGTTGEPNAVLVTHRNVVRLAKGPKWINLEENDRILATSTLQFDASTFEIWGALLNGLTLCIASKDEILNPDSLKALIAQHGVTILWLTSPLFTQLANADVTIFERLKILLTGGDVVSPRDAHQVLQRYPALTIINGYGPTENTTFSTTFAIDREYSSRLPIGKPIPNSTAYIVDADDNLQPIGVTGELKVGGDGVAKGYLNNPALTAERFRPFLTEERVYSTGDLARWLPDGNIDFLGRIDDQVKIRGFRIEPREIEIALKCNPQIEDALVIGRTDGNGEKVLCAYVVTQQQDLRGLKDQLAHSLPDYMIPSHFVRLNKLPLTPHGKIDRQRLPAPAVSSNERPEAAGDDLEEEMVAIWKEVLGLNDIGIHEDFFDMGGHSM